jgi:FixJ family two-component response regulator
MQRTGAQVTVAHTKQEAVRALQDLERWHAVSLDLTLDKEEVGLQLLADLRQRGSRVPVVVVTGHWEKELAREAQSLGAEYAPKPIDVSNMKALVAKATEYAADTSRLTRERVAKVAARLGLSPNLAAVLTGLALGQRNESIAAELGVAVGTVKWHAGRVFDLMGVSTRKEVGPELARLAEEGGSEQPAHKSPPGALVEPEEEQEDGRASVGASARSRERRERT